MILLALLACTEPSPSEGTVVGNPGDAALRLARTSGISGLEAYVVVSGLEMTGCSAGMVESREAREEIDLVRGGLLSLPAGDWCGVRLQFGAPVEIFGSAEDDDEVGLEAFLDIGEVLLDSSSAFAVDGASFVLELGEPGWLDRDSFERTGEDCEELWEYFEELEEACDEEDDEEACEELEELEEEIRECGMDEIDEDHPSYTELVSALSSGSGLYADPDGDREISAEERDAGPVASGPDRSDAPSGEGGDPVADASASPPVDDGLESESFPIGGGCGSEASLSLMLLPLGLFVRRRRR